MKIKHRIPPEAYFRSDPITPEYQAEVDRSVAKAERREADAKRRLAAAEERMAIALRIRSAKQRDRAVRVAAELIEMRRGELLAIQRGMSSVPSSAAHRSRDAHRPVPGMRTL